MFWWPIGATVWAADGNIWVHPETVLGMCFKTGSVHVLATASPTVDESLNSEDDPLLADRALAFCVDELAVRLENRLHEEGIVTQ